MSCAPAEWNRRRAAARRLPPMHCCVDPWTCRCGQEDSSPPSRVVVDAWFDTLWAILNRGVMPGLPPIDVLRALHRRGGGERVVAEALYDEYRPREDAR